MSQEALGSKARINRVTIARLEAALHPPNIETLDRIARALGVTLVDLVQ
jgi:transcriptional regulator with XRE-family HTH domain